MARRAIVGVLIEVDRRMARDVDACVITTREAASGPRLLILAVPVGRLDHTCRQEVDNG